jgi:fructose-bisphosphate aldolase/2-amino-3,7-dideoxy-D-threo-hept-6-ulosonate synthase
LNEYIEAIDEITTKRMMVMTVDGKKIRLRRIADKDTGKFVIVPMDHGVTNGPIKGIVDLGETIDRVHAGGATAVVIHKGMVTSGLEEHGSEIGLIVHLSASTKIGLDSNAKVLVSSVEEAIQMGADAISVQVNIGSETESEMLRDMGKVSEACTKWRMPLLAMMYPRGPDITDPFDVLFVKHVARLGAELGADIVKTNYTGSVETFSEVVKGCPVPVVIAGGPKVESDKEVLQMVQDAMRAGAAGISIGRNIFQNKSVTAMTRAIASIIIEDIDVNYAYKELMK